MVAMVTTKMYQSHSRCVDYSYIKRFEFVFGPQTEIFYIVYCLIVQFSFVTSRNLLLFSFCKTSIKENFLVFIRFFSENCQDLDL